MMIEKEKQNTETLFELRTRHGLTQKEVAQLISCDVSTIGHEERGSSYKRLDIDKRKLLEDLFSQKIKWKPVPTKRRITREKDNQNENIGNLRKEISRVDAYHKARSVSTERKVNHHDSYLKSCWATIKCLEETLPSVQIVDGKSFLVIPIPKEET